MGCACITQKKLISNDLDLNTNINKINYNEIKDINNMYREEIKDIIDFSESKISDDI